MFKLIINEWIKIFKRPGTYVMIGLLVLMVGGLASLSKYNEVKNTGDDQGDWKKELTQENVNHKKQLENGDISKSYKQYLEKEVAINEYRIEHNLTPYSKESVWSFTMNASDLIQIVGLFVIVIAAGIVASEFTWGTVKLLLIRPISRSKILISKYITVMLFGVTMLALMFSLSFILGAILFGTGGENTYLAYIDGEVVEQSMFLHLIKFYLLNSIGIFMLSTLAFLISSVFRNSSLAIGISLFLLFTGGTVTYLISTKFDWAKYILFANTDLMQYENGTVLIEGMTPAFSVTMLIIYFVLFQFITFFFFNKRDVAA
ncbi:ABC-2 type transport system permease protein [Oikeobacillus pervagus]|uniref:ABC-2 type transport system permease protein n=1 Tax=Oikeobacillus pervagus TaxID=1325931 RepID=A0AAJ1SY35_9BACI|nr:DUF2705 family protein [Oikeobacillus pervagus]MDQ0214604.1 ABC-2 type transport system permease protein [Oikeobacillus pervagus]